jgi:glycosyltransferase involved in cell wall biosynthesis
VSRPRIIVGITVPGIGGAQNYVAQLVPALVERYDVIVTAHGRGPLSEAVERDGARFVPLRWVRRSLGPWDAVGVLELVRLFRRERPDVVHLNSSKMGILGRIAAAVARVPVRVFTVHGWAFKAYTGPASWLYRWADRLVRPLTTMIICPAESERAVGVRVRTCDPQQSTVIPNAVDVAAAQVSRLDGDPPLVVSVGRMDFPKDFVTLARALNRLEPDSFRGEIVGDGSDRPLVEQELAAAGEGRSIVLTGLREDVAAVLGGADVFVLSSQSECMPLSVLEAMAAGLPVVASAVGGVPEIVVDGETGLLVSPGDPDALAGALARVLGDGQERRAMGAAGQERARKHHDLPAFREAHLALYERELARALPT